MAVHRAFKSDVSFLEKISMGAVGSRGVFENLKNQGHDPLELERGSMSFKIWKKIKIKRIRVPDIVCVTCGRRVESRAKTVFEVSMSHSLSDPERGWDYGLEDSDFVALVVCRRSGDRPVDWQADKLVQYISVGALRAAQREGRAVLIRPKGAQEGFEARIGWPAAVANSAGSVLSVSREHIQYCRQDDNRKITLRLTRQGLFMEPQVSEGHSIVQHQVLAAVVPVGTQLPCDGAMKQEHYLNRLASPSLSERFAATKVLSRCGSQDAVQALLNKTTEDNEHIYVRLEAAAGLARHGEELGWSFIKRCLTEAYLQHRLEAVIILAEIPADASCRLLSTVLTDKEQNTEIRAGAAWALGELSNKLALNTLIDSFASVSEEIRTEAARALAKLAGRFSQEVVSKFPGATPDTRPGIAWALSRSRGFSLKDLQEMLVDEDARQWVAYMLGTQDQSKYIGQMESLRARDPEVYFAVTVLWKIMTSWVYNLEEYG